MTTPRSLRRLPRSPTRKNSEAFRTLTHTKREKPTAAHAANRKSNGRNAGRRLTPWARDSTVADDAFQ